MGFSSEVTRFELVKEYVSNMGGMFGCLVAAPQVATTILDLAVRETLVLNTCCKEKRRETAIIFERLKLR
ncbi:hypothetical protein NECAME_10532 [Necator americanus]|uniref:Uncharacterized protein n=1 Tax=Necator americanus TaxID=51031 RepID=W2TAW3_NECAM|nr:hypothetical protein NECAME_10532 [Necator americanus]ETN78157.1 hypothetical protein NECAME_10532 [Necator americanus]